MSTLPAKTEVLLRLTKNSWKTKIKFFYSSLIHMKTTINLMYFVNGCPS